MKRFVGLAAVALLAGCLGKPETPEPGATASDSAASGTAMGEASMAAADASAAPAAAPTPGSYDVTGPDGVKAVTTIMADGKFVDRDEGGKVIAKGKMIEKDGKTCFAPEKGAEECYTDSAPDADGAFTATAADGKVTHVSPHKKM